MVKQRASSMAKTCPATSAVSHSSACNAKPLGVDLRQDSEVELDIVSGVI